MAFDLTKPSMSDADWPTFAANVRENFRAIVQDAMTFLNKTLNSPAVSGNMTHSGGAIVQAGIAAPTIDASTWIYTLSGTGLILQSGGSIAFRTNSVATDRLTVSPAGVVEATTSFKIAGGTAVTKIVVYTPTLSPAAIAANTTAEQTFSVPGLTTSDAILYINKPTAQAGLGIVGVRVSAADTLAITFSNNTAASITPTAAQVYRLVALRS